MSTKNSRNSLGWQDYALHETIHHALEDERQRLATQLDNTLIQQINLIMGQINVYEQTASAGSRMAFSVLANLVRQLLQQTYDLQTSLNPIMLNNLGLEPALEAFVNQQRRNHGVTLQLSTIHFEKRLPAVIELALFRITQDIVRHAILVGNASHITIQLRQHTSTLRYSIEDNGNTSIDMDLTKASERISMLGGALVIQKSSYGGMEVAIEFDATPSIDLTEREMDVIRLVAEGLTNREIALQLEVRPRTVKFHLDNIFSKLGVNSRTQAAITALRQGWVSHINQNPPAQTDNP